MTSISEATDMVLDSDPDDWEFFEPLDTHTYAEDVELTLVNDGLNHQKFSEEWTSHYPAESTSYNFYLYYSGSPIEYRHVVSVDGGRAMIPVPDRNHPNASSTFSLGKYDQKIAEILTHRSQELDRYYETGNLEIRE